MQFRCDFCSKESNIKEGWKELDFFDRKVTKGQEKVLMCDICLTTLEANVLCDKRDLKKIGVKYIYQ